MVEVVWTFDVPVERQAEYLKATTEKIKPFWESHGCLAYDVWQATEGELAFQKRMLFTDMSAMEKAMELARSGPEAIQLWRSFVPSSTRRTYIKRT